MITPTVTNMKQQDSRRYIDFDDNVSTNNDGNLSEEEVPEEVELAKPNPRFKSNGKLF
jgi:hypothetical protein